MKRIRTLAAITGAIGIYSLCLVVDIIDRHKHKEENENGNGLQ